MLDADYDACINANICPNKFSYGFDETPTIDFLKKEMEDEVVKIKECKEHEKTMQNVGYKQYDVTEIPQEKNSNSSDDEEQVVEYEQFDKDPSVNFSDNSNDMEPMEIITKEKEEQKNKQHEAKVDMEFEDFEESDVQDKWSHIKIDHAKVKEAMSKVNFDIKPSWQSEE